MNRVRLGAGLLLVAAIWGCSNQPTTPASPSSSPPPAASPLPSSNPSTPPSTPPSAEPSARPSTQPSTPPNSRPAPKLAKGSIAMVVTDNLRVRSKPEVSDSSKKLEPLLDDLRRVYVLDGPVVASGFTWYQVEPVIEPGEFAAFPFGWVAAADKDGTPWLARDDMECPAKPTTANAVYAMSGLVGLACFGDTPLRVTAWLAQPEATCGIDLGWSVEPEWLGSTCPQPTFLLGFQERPEESANAVIDPKVDVSAFRPGVEQPDWVAVTLTGQFDHPAATTCKGYSYGQPVTAPAAQIRLSCRATFAITAIAAR